MKKARKLVLDGARNEFNLNVSLEVWICGFRLIVLCFLFCFVG